MIIFVLPATTRSKTSVLASVIDDVNVLVFTYALFQCADKSAFSGLVSIPSVSAVCSSVCVL